MRDTREAPASLDGVLWWSFYESQASFDSFVRAAVAYASGGEVDPASIPSAYNACQMLLPLLAQKRILLVLDGLERILNAYTRLDAPYQGDDVKEDPEQRFRACTDPHAARFLKSLCSLSHQSRVLITSRLFPRDLDDLPGCAHNPLDEFDLEDAIAFFRAQEIKGTRAEVATELGRYGCHPLALRLLSGMIVSDPERPGDIAIAREYNPVDGLVPREHHILKIAYEALTQEKQQLLSRLAAFRFPMYYAAAQAISDLPNVSATKQALRELVARGLLQRSADDPPRFHIHPIVRHYAYTRIADRQSVHARLAAYFRSLPKPAPGADRDIEELQPTIEWYYHTAGAGELESARVLFYHRLHDSLYYRYGAYLACVELLSELFPDRAPLNSHGEAQLPLLKKEAGQAWALASLANAYSLCGHPRVALQIALRCESINEGRQDTANLATILSNIAHQLIVLGDLRVAEATLRRRIALSRELEHDQGEAIGHQVLGHLLTYLGEDAEARQELASSTACWQGANHVQGLCLDEIYRALLGLLLWDTEGALAAAQRARSLAPTQA